MSYSDDGKVHQLRCIKEQLESTRGVLGEKNEEIVEIKDQLKRIADSLEILVEKHLIR